MPQPTTQPTTATNPQKRNDLRDRIGNLSYDDRLYILEILKQHLPPSKIIENADGCRVNLDTVSDDLVDKLYHIMMTRLSTTNCLTHNLI